LPEFKGQGAGKTLVKIALEAARADAHKVVMLVGDEPYYGPLGFTRLAPGAIWSATSAAAVTTTPSSSTGVRRTAA